MSQSGLPPVVVIGGAGVDICGAPHSKLRLRDSNPGSVTLSAGGVGRNIAANLCRLGTQCRFVSVVGNDAFGDFLLAQSQQCGLDMRHVSRVDGNRTSAYLSVLDEHGDMQAAVADMQAMATLTPALLQAHERMFSQAAALVTDANLSTDCLRWLVDTFPDKTLFADPVSGSKAPRLQSVLPYLHAITPGLLEAESLSGRSARTDRELADMADWFHGQGVALVFITLSERGVYYSGNGARGKLVPRLPRRRIVNAGGAGDAFTAAVVYAWLRSWPLRQTAGFAMAVAELTLACTTASSPALSVESAMETYERFYAE